MRARDVVGAVAGGGLVVLGALICLLFLELTGRLDAGAPDPAAEVLLHVPEDPDGHIVRTLLFVAEGPLSRGGPVWVDDEGRTQAWLGWHDELPGGEVHHAFEVKTAADPGGSTPEVLATRFRIGSDADQTEAAFYSTSVLAVENGVAGGDPFGIEFRSPASGAVLDGTAQGSDTLGRLVVSEDRDGAVTMDIGVGADDGSASVLRLLHDDGGEGPRRLQIAGSGDEAAWDFDAGAGSLFVRDAERVPRGTTRDGGHLYADDGALVWRGSDGTVTTLAEP